MTPAQTKFYWRAWGAAARALKAASWAKEDVDAERMQCHVRACGDAVSSKDLTNREFDAVLAEFWALSKNTPARQNLRQAEQPDVRWLYQAIRLARRIKPEISSDENAIHYIEGVGRRVAKHDGEIGDFGSSVQLPWTPDEQQRIMAALKYSAMRQTRRARQQDLPAHNEPTTPQPVSTQAGNTEGDPF